MIIVNLKGGLGNQMFQYAFGTSLALKLNSELKLDTQGLDNAKKVGDIYRPFTLSKFNIKASVATPEEISELKHPNGIFSKLKRKIIFKLSRDKNVLFNQKWLEVKDNSYLDGYWQSPLYFEGIRQELISDFTLKDPLSPEANSLLQEMRNNLTISVHVRRRDYITNSRVNKEFGICSMNYYQSALNLMKEKIPEATFLVFSDDIAWCQNNFPPDTKIKFTSQSLADTESLVLMSKCHHNIIANSSFSFWCAWLNQNPDKIVIAPEPWFDHQSYDQNLIPKSWIKIKKN